MLQVNNFEKVSIVQHSIKKFHRIFYIAMLSYNKWYTNETVWKLYEENIYFILFGLSKNRKYIFSLIKFLLFSRNNFDHKYVMDK